MNIICDTIAFFQRPNKIQYETQNLSNQGSGLMQTAAMNKIPQQRQQRQQRVTAAAAATMVFVHGCRLAYVIYNFIFDLICYFY